jgi:hypothetical protein
LPEKLDIEENLDVAAELRQAVPFGKLMYKYSSEIAIAEFDKFGRPSSPNRHCQFDAACQRAKNI